MANQRKWGKSRSKKMGKVNKRKWGMRRSKKMGTINKRKWEWANQRKWGRSRSKKMGRVNLESEKRINQKKLIRASKKKTLLIAAENYVNLPNFKHYKHSLLSVWRKNVKFRLAAEKHWWNEGI